MGDIAPIINIAAVAAKGIMPIAGGVLDQSNWFFEAWQALENDQNRIDNERLERMKRK